MQGDCLELMKDIPDGSVDLIVTDPPYLKAHSTGYRKNTKRKDTEILNDREFDLDNLLQEYKRLLKEDGHIYICLVVGRHPINLNKN